MIECRIQNLPYRVLNDYRLTEQVGNKTSTEITVEVAAGLPFPQANDIITVTDLDTNTALFWGLCGIPKSPKYETGYEKKLYKIVCGNGNYILSKRIVNEAYQTATVTAIVTDLFDKYIETEGITLGRISAIPVSLSVYTAKNLNLQECLNELATLVGAVWRVTPDRQFFFEVTDDFPSFPWNAIQPRGGITFQNVFGSLQKTTKEYTQRTVQYVYGGRDLTSTQTEIKPFSAEQDVYTVSFDVYNRPTISYSDDGSTWTMLPATAIGVTGLNDGDNTFVFFFTSGSPQIKYNTQTVSPLTAAYIKIEYVGSFPIQTVSENSEKIAELAGQTGTSGRRENAVQVSGIVSVNESMAYGQQVLEKYADPTEEIAWTFLSSDLTENGLTLDDVDLLTVVKFDMPDYDITGDFVITERVLEAFYITDDVHKYVVKLKLMSRDYMKSYGETIASLKKDVSQLSVRDEDVIIKNAGVAETLYLGEAMRWSDAPLYFPTETIIEGSLVAPCDLGQDNYIYTEAV